MKNTQKAGNLKRINKFTNQVKEIREEEAKDCGELAFVHKYLVTGAFPHSEPDNNFYSVLNGRNAIWVKGGSTINAETGEEITVGVPYGSLPRLITAWISTEAVKNRVRQVQLGLSLSHFLKELGLNIDGRDIARVKAQLFRLAHCEIGYKRVDKEENKSRITSRRYRLIEGEEFWDWTVPNQTAIFGSYIILDQNFFQKLLEKPVPVDMRALKAIKSSPLALDLYMWLTYRVFNIKEDGVYISWGQVMNQLGASYADERYFAIRAKKYLKRIKSFWPELHYRTPRGRLFLSPESRPHIRR